MLWESQKIILDIADIELHHPDGTSCTGVDPSKNPTDLIAICPEFFLLTKNLLAI